MKVDNLLSQNSSPISQSSVVGHQARNYNNNFAKALKLFWNPPE